jgi:hypothetical protein
MNADEIVPRHVKANGGTKEAPSAALLTPCLPSRTPSIHPSVGNDFSRMERGATLPDDEPTGHFKDEPLTAGDRSGALLPAFSALQGGCQ